MTEWLHPAVPYLLGALLIPLLRGRVRQAYLLLIPLLSLIAVVMLTVGEFGRVSFMGQELILGQVDKLSILFAYVFALMGFIGTIYALQVKNPGEHMAAFLYVGSALGVVFAGDYFTLFIFWEIMAFASAYLVFIQGGAAAIGAGFRYLLVHISGGVCLLGGIVLHYHATGSILFGAIEIGDNAQANLAFYLILTGFMLNAAVPPLNAWLTDAYPEATVTGAVFMSAFTTKTAVYVLLRAYPGTEILIWLGAVMAIYGVIYAVMENDARRLLAYHIISQVGYMVAGVGIGTEMAVNGSGAHAFSHILYKGLLFMGAGAVILMAGRRKLTELGGLYKQMPITLVLYMVGALSISAFPFFSGFVSKSMVVAAATGDQHAIVALMLLLASSGTFLHTGLKLPYYMFFGKDQGLKVKEPPLNMLIAMGIAATLCIGIGIFPDLLYGLLPYAVTFEPYTGAHITETLGILLFTGLGFALFLKHLDPENTISLDTDWFYRKGARGLMWLAEKPIARYEAMVSNFSNSLVLKPLHAVAAMGLWVDKHIIDGAVNGVAHNILNCGSVLRRLQDGILSHYALAIVIGVLGCTILYVVV
jgi:multicomponent Na+:H+ antiporter subunit D